MKQADIYEEQKRLVLARFKTLSPDSKVLLIGEEEMSVRDLIRHVERGDEFGQNVIRVQMKMLRVLAGTA